MSVGSINLKPSIFHVSQWQDFNPGSQRQTNAQVWVQIYDLLIECWRPSNFYRIARDTGLPLEIDQKILDLDNDLFARILVDIDSKCGGGIL